MYTVDIICSNGHQFEAWFSSRSDFEEQLDGSIIACPICSDMNVQQALTPIRIKKRRDERTTRGGMPSKPQLDPSVIEDSFEDVGEDFAEEAIRMFTGEAEERNIRGTATDEEQEDLIEEGVPFVKIPDLQ
jgi:hypothetical protein